jgi:hypothetical protein
LVAIFFNKFTDSCFVRTFNALQNWFRVSFLDQKHLQHSHSHFAFTGWISHTLMVLMILFLENKTTRTANTTSNKYKKILTANLVCAYGMLVFFIIQGYGLFSIIFATASIFVACVFAYFYFQDLKRIAKDDLSVNWFKAAFVF